MLFIFGYMSRSYKTCDFCLINYYKKIKNNIKEEICYVRKLMVDPTCLEWVQVPIYVNGTGLGLLPVT